MDRSEPELTRHAAERDVCGLRCGALSQGISRRLPRRRRTSNPPPGHLYRGPTLFGVAAREGFEIAVEEINASGGILGKKIKTIIFAPNAEKWTNLQAKKYAKKYTDIILICGRYEGIDARVDKILKTKIHLKTKWLKLIVKMKLERRHKSELYL